jgi:hypothetical protein
MPIGKKRDVLIDKILTTLGAEAGQGVALRTLVDNHPKGLRRHARFQQAQMNQINETRT